MDVANSILMLVSIKLDAKALLCVFFAKPEEQTPKPDIYTQVLPKTPRHAVQILGREHCPDEQMSPEQRASSHNEEETARDEHCEQGEVSA